MPQNIMDPTLNRVTYRPLPHRLEVAMAGSRFRPPSLRTYRLLLSEPARALADRIHPVTILFRIVTCAPRYDGIFFATAANGQLTLATDDGLRRAIVFGIACFCGG